VNARGMGGLQCRHQRSAGARVADNEIPRIVAHRCIIEASIDVSQKQRNNREKACNKQRIAEVSVLISDHAE
jgi:hypothetical protein